MKTIIPEKEVEICDICKRESFLMTCLVCGKEYCWSCKGMIARCWVMPDICKVCSDIPAVESIVLQYAEKITPIIKERNEALKKLQV